MFAIVNRPVATVLIALSFLLPRAVAAQDQHDHDHPAPQRLGTVDFPTTCAASTKAEFNRATALMHSFAFHAASKGFEKVLTEDPSCGIAAWGIALSAWSNPFAGMKVGPPIEKGTAAVMRAQTIGAKSQRERDYIAAVAELYKNADSVDHPTRIAAYERAMARVAATYPDDGEAQIFSALASLQTAAPTDKTYAKQLQAGEVLERMFAKAPDHPGLAHYIIHAYDVPPLAPRALDAARRYSQIAPDAAHALHMPSHTFTRVGYWRESVESNLASAAAAKREGTTAEQLHALDYQTYAYLQMGQDQAVSRILADLPSIVAGLEYANGGRRRGPSDGGGIRRLGDPCALRARARRVGSRRVAAAACHCRAAGAGGHPLRARRWCGTHWQGIDGRCRHRPPRRTSRRPDQQEGRLLGRASRDPARDRLSLGGMDCRTQGRSALVGGASRRRGRRD